MVNLRHLQLLGNLICALGARSRCGALPIFLWCSAIEKEMNSLFTWLALTLGLLTLSIYLIWGQKLQNLNLAFREFSFINDCAYTYNKGLLHLRQESKKPILCCCAIALGRIQSISKIV